MSGVASGYLAAIRYRLQQTTDDIKRSVYKLRNFISQSKIDTKSALFVTFAIDLYRAFWFQNAYFEMAISQNRARIDPVFFTEF